jgi:hypothetical protein
MAPPADVLTPEEARGRLAGRKLQELDQKLDGLRAELASWLGASGQGGRLRKHHSQVLRLTDQLGGMADAIGEQIGGLAAGGDDAVARARTLQMQILEVHRLWDFFRAKLSLRYVDWFAEPLAIADDLAWACQQPARAAAEKAGGTGARTAPLLFFSGDFSAYTHAERTPFEVEAVPGALDSQAFREAVASLPIPVIGVPWYQVAHLPDAPVIAHEVAHDVTAALGLRETFAEHARPVLEASPQRATAWSAWIEEVHADLYGVLCLGPAFASAMADLLATDPVQVAMEARVAAAWVKHPPAARRMECLVHALRRLGFDAAADERETAWEASFPPAQGDPYRADGPALVDALLDGHYDALGGSLLDTVSFTTAQQADAIAVKDSMLLGLSPPSGEARTLVAGARLAFDQDPEGYREPVREGDPTPQELVLARAKADRTDEPRAEEVDTSPGSDADRSAGAELFARLIRPATTTEGSHEPWPPPSTSGRRTRFTSTARPQRDSRP